jgi:hypothetical protein
LKCINNKGCIFLIKVVGFLCVLGLHITYPLTRCELTTWDDDFEFTYISDDYLANLATIVNLTTTTTYIMDQDA